VPDGWMDADDLARHELAKRDLRETGSV
jgi:hypothetical protein